MGSLSRFMLSLPQCNVPGVLNYMSGRLKLKCGQYTAPVTLYPKAPLYNIIIIVDTGGNKISNTKGNEVNNIAILSLWHA